MCLCVYICSRKSIIKFLYSYVICIIYMYILYVYIILHIIIYIYIHMIYIYILIYIAWYSSGRIRSGSPTSPRVSGPGIIGDTREAQSVVVAQQRDILPHHQPRIARQPGRPAGPGRGEKGSRKGGLKTWLKTWFIVSNNEELMVMNSGY